MGRGRRCRARCAIAFRLVRRVSTMSVRPKARSCVNVSQKKTQAPIATNMTVVLTVAIVAGGGDNVRHKGASDESYVDGAVGEEDKPPVACARFQLTRGLGTAHGAGGVFAAYANANEETPVSGGSVGACTGGEMSHAKKKHTGKSKDSRRLDQRGTVSYQATRMEKRPMVSPCQ